MSQSSKSDKPFSLRLSANERALLEQWAGEMTLGEYIRRTVFQDNREVRRYIRRPIKDHEALAKVLSELGRGHIANNLNQLAKAANSGTWPLLIESKPLLLSACADIRTMRQHLLAALGHSQGKA